MLLFMPTAHPIEALPYAKGCLLFVGLALRHVNIEFIFYLGNRNTDLLSINKYKNLSNLCNIFNFAYLILETKCFTAIV